MLKHVSFEHGDTDREYHVVIPQKLTNLKVEYDRGRFLLSFNGKPVYSTCIGIEDFSVTVDDTEPSPEFMEKHVGIVVTCDGETLGGCDAPDDGVVHWVPRHALTLYNKSGVRMALITYVCPYCNIEHTGRVFTTADYKVTAIENDDGMKSDVMTKLPEPKPAKIGPMPRIIQGNDDDALQEKRKNLKKAYKFATGKKNGARETKKRGA